MDGLTGIGYIYIGKMFVRARGLGGLSREGGPTLFRKLPADVTMLEQLDNVSVGVTECGY